MTWKSSTVGPVFAPALALALALAVTAPCHPAEHFAKPLSYDVELAPVAGSGVTGIAHLVLRGDQLTVLVRAFGLDPNAESPISIVPADGTRTADCPTAATAAAGRSSAVSADRSGTSPVRLVPSPASDLRGAVAFEHRYTVEVSELRPLTHHLFVLQDEGPEAEALACGRIVPYE